MLKDFSIGNQILYYLSSMTLSIVLFLLRILYTDFENTGFSHIQVAIVVLLVIGILFACSIFLYRSIKRKYTVQTYQHQDEYESDNFSKENISEINGQPVSFLISNVTSVYVIDSFPIPSILAFSFIHLLLFFLMIKGQNLQPNLFLYLYGIDIYKTKNNDFLIDLNDDQLSHNEILKLNAHRNGRTYIIGDLRNQSTK